MKSTDEELIAFYKEPKIDTPFYNVINEIRRNKTFICTI